MLSLFTIYNTCKAMYPKKHLQQCCSVKCFLLWYCPKKLQPASGPFCAVQTPTKTGIIFKIEKKDKGMEEKL